MLDLDAAGAGFESLRERLSSLDDPLAAELVQELQTQLEQLRVAEAELARQNDELADLQHALAAEADRYRTLFDVAPVAYATTDLGGVIREANAATATLFGVDPRFLLGKPLVLYADEQDRRRLRAYILAVAGAGAGDAPFSVRMRNRDGVAFEIAVRALATERDIRWVLHDVTEERQAEQRLWELNRELELRVQEQAGEIETVLEQLPIGVVIIDARTETIRRANRRALAIFEGAIGIGARIDVLNRYREGRRLDHDEWPVVRALRGEPIARETVSVQLGDGSTRVIEVNAVPVLREATIVSAVVTFDDVTHRERREQAEREFVSNAAHQLRTPLAAIASTVAVLQSGAKDDPVARDRFLSHLERETDRLSRLGRALLTLARAQRGEERPPVAIVPLRALLDTVIADATPKDGVTITMRCAGTVAALANAELLEEALGNLLANAISYTDAGEIAVSATRRDSRVTIEIADTGPGMTRDARQHAFDRFFRGDVQRRGGFGLGLPIAKAAVEAAGGEIELESEERRGTTARVTLRAATMRT